MSEGLSSSDQHATPRVRPQPVQVLTLVVAVVFLAVGALGFVPGITTNYGDMELAGPDSEALLLGIFQVSVLHNLVHLAFGVVGIVLARTPLLAVSYLLGGGLIYLAVWLYGIIINLDGPINILSLNDADNWLHLGLAVGMIGLGTIFIGSVTSRTSGQAK